MRPEFCFEINTNILNKKVFVFKIEQNNPKFYNTDIRNFSFNILKEIYVKNKK
jgi:hypothetical protein